jgi:hypothetical protein
MVLAKKRLLLKTSKAPRFYLSPIHLALAPTRRPAQYLYDMHGVSGGTMSGIKW